MASDFASGTKFLQDLELEIPPHFPPVDVTAERPIWKLTR